MPMERFRTEISPALSKFPIDYHSNCLFIGSCFTENIGKKMQELKFSTIINPFGVVYNPLSVINCCNILLNDRLFTETDLHYYNEQWFSFYHHSSFSHPNRDICLQNINTAIGETAQYLQSCSHLFITFGTAWVYKLLLSGEVVSNCHKLPASHFERNLLTINKIVDEAALLFHKLRATNSDLKVILTVSPVRHIKDGAHGNQLSKGILLLAVEQLCKLNFVEYFPAYELVLDDLRDYRFYDADMLHPNQLAIDYVWEKFVASNIHSECSPLMLEISKIVHAKKHRVFNPTTNLHKQFVISNKHKIEELLKKHPYINLEEELDYFSMD